MLVTRDVKTGASDVHGVCNSACENLSGAFIWHVKGRCSRRLLLLVILVILIILITVMIIVFTIIVLIIAYNHN